MSQPNVWIIDHRDSFTWNLAELAAATGMAVPRVVPHDFPGLEDAVRKGEKVILSPGPGVVHDSCHRATFRLLRRLPPDIPVLGVCLGHQILGVHFGAALEQLPSPLHGARAQIRRCGPSPLFAGLPEEFTAGLYHSWRLSRESWPDELIVTAEDGRGHIQAIRHRNPVSPGIHPDSVRQPHDAQFPSAFSGIKEGRQRTREFPHARNGDEQERAGSCLIPVHVRRAPQSGPSITASIS